MYILNRRNFLQLTAGAAVGTALSTYTGPVSAAGLGASADVFTADPLGGLVDSVLVVGEEKLLLIDAQFTVPNATRLADIIDATGKDLETIFVTHYHPDHHLGLAVLMARFPNAKPVAHSSVQPAIANAAEAMRAGSAQNYPEGMIADSAFIPDALAGDMLMLEGERFDVLGPMHGDTDIITPVHMPQLDTLVAADMIYNDTHLWTAENTTAERIALWRDNLTELEGLGATTIIPGHRTETTANDASGFAHMRTYLDAWEVALADTQNAADLKAAMIEKVGALPGEFFLDRGVAAAKS
ncbi:MAG: MBL fold metallo-hydrolase [Pseudomonadota bacterium]